MWPVVLEGRVAENHLKQLPETRAAAPKRAFVLFHRFGKLSRHDFSSLRSTSFLVESDPGAAAVA